MKMRSDFDMCVTSAIDVVCPPDSSEKNANIDALAFSLSHHGNSTADVGGARDAALASIGFSSVVGDATRRSSE